jgi:hypothetical protein
VIKSTSQHISLFQVVCRQIYHETRFLPYELNEFSFQVELTMSDWYNSRAVEQKRAINMVWFGLEWMYRSWYMFPLTIRKALKAGSGSHRGITKVYVSTTAVEHMSTTTSKDMEKTLQRSEFTGWVARLLQKKLTDVQIEFVD